MKKLHIANTNFEFELSTNKVLSLEQMMEQSPICLQLQFLPLLFADLRDEVLVTGRPDKNFSVKMVFDAESGEIQSWGWSQTIAKWAKERGISYAMPPWEIVREVNSKRWSFENSPKLERAACAYSKQELEDWAEGQFESVAKSCFGLSGRGNYRFNQVTPELLSFCTKEWQAGRPVILEPWVQRMVDFSTQWHVAKDRIDFIGATEMLNTEGGAYLGTLVGYIPSQEHMSEAERILHKMQQLGYFGYAGIDAMIYRKEGKTCLQPIVEVNARMTMALAAIFIQKKWHSGKKILFQYGKFSEGLLPNFIQYQNKTVKFNRQLKISVLD